LNPYTSGLWHWSLKRQVFERLPKRRFVIYRGQDVGVAFRAELVVEGQLLLELKCVEQLSVLHVAQTVTYLKLLGLKRGFLINFNTRLLKHGIRRVSF